MISFSDVGDKVSNYVNDDFIDKVDEFVVDGTSRDEDRWASSGDDSTSCVMFRHFPP